jgi:hypothetical protein
MVIWEDPTARRILGRLNDLENYPDDALVSYEEFTLEEKIYYFTPGGFLYRKEEPGWEELGGVFCGYLSDEVWHYRAGGGTQRRGRKGAA